jgi:sugar lactone lactonase YvrE
MKNIALPLFLSFILCAFSCDQKSYYEAKDFTPDGLFTSGIEGPATDAQGNLYVVNFEREGTIGKVTPAGEASLFVALPEGSTGNGIRFNKNGDMLIADYTGHNILKVNMQTKEISVLAHEAKMNQPNDITITTDDYIYASDPNWREGTGNLWLISPMGEVTLLESDMGTTNGVEVSRDGKRLYVNESRQLNLWVYDIATDKSISNKRLLYKFEGFGLDGMRCDDKGNLYVTRYGKGTVEVISPEGNLIREITVPGKSPSNITFHNNRAYVTLQDRGSIATFDIEP